MVRCARGCTGGARCGAGSGRHHTAALAEGAAGGTGRGHPQCTPRHPQSALGHREPDRYAQVREAAHREAGGQECCTHQAARRPQRSAAGAREAARSAADRPVGQHLGSRLQCRGHSRADSHRGGPHSQVPHSIAHRGHRAGQVQECRRTGEHGHTADEGGQPRCDVPACLLHLRPAGHAQPRR